VRPLDHNLEYLLWYESQRQRWVAVPVIREGNLILDADYAEVIGLDLEL
jgi:hypothetical protein